MMKYSRTNITSLDIKGIKVFYTLENGAHNIGISPKRHGSHATM